LHHFQDEAHNLQTSWDISLTNEAECVRAMQTRCQQELLESRMKFSTTAERREASQYNIPEHIHETIRIRSKHETAQPTALYDLALGRFLD
jgi:hypothetical protein